MLGSHALTRRFRRQHSPILKLPTDLQNSAEAPVLRLSPRFYSIFQYRTALQQTPPPTSTRRAACRPCRSTSEVEKEKLNEREGMGCSRADHHKTEDFQLSSQCDPHSERKCKRRLLIHTLPALFFTSLQLPTTTDQRHHPRKRVGWREVGVAVMASESSSERRECTSARATCSPAHEQGRAQPAGSVSIAHSAARRDDANFNRRNPQTQPQANDYELHPHSCCHHPTWLTE